MKIGAIDIGSNAARLVIKEVTKTKNGDTQFTKLTYLRIPLRLGFDVFETGVISAERTEMLLNAMHTFNTLLKTYDAKIYRACATSALRDAKNGKELMRLVKRKTGIAIEIISGDEEANLLFQNYFSEHLDAAKNYLFIDVGGGSTELSFLSEGKLKAKQSFNIGTIRLLKNLITDKDWAEMKAFTINNSPIALPAIAVGSGGNINKAFSMSQGKEGKPVTLKTLRKLHKSLSVLTVEERMRQYHLREDRADVIVPALQIFSNVMRWADSDEILVPKVGLADGMIQSLYDAASTKSVV